MSFWNKIWPFSGNDKPCHHPQLLSHEPLVRTAEEMEGYVKWSDSLPKRKMLDWIRESYSGWCSDCDKADLCIDFMDMASAKGFVIHFQDKDYACREMIYLFEHLKNIAMKKEYVPYLSDVKVFEKRCWKETIQRHYLKPSIHLPQINGKSDQRYGNINIELRFRDNQPLHLKFLVTPYNDRQFTQPLPFDELFEQITEW